MTFNIARIVLAALWAVWLTGCLPVDSESTAVDGSVLGQAFSASSGVAEEASGKYFITLSDDPGFGCASNPTGDYLTVEMAEVDGSGTYQASGNVTFNAFEANVIESEAATSGTFSVEIDQEQGSATGISGTIDATGPDSRAEGSFDVPVCQ